MVDATDLKSVAFGHKGSSPFIRTNTLKKLRVYKMLIKIKANEELFHKFHELGETLKGLSSIVQNDIEISQEQWQEWQDLFRQLDRETFDLYCNVYKYIHS